MIKKGAVVLDLSYPKGDCQPGVAQVASFFTPVPGGLGPVTIACLFENLLELYKYSNTTKYWSKCTLSLVSCLFTDGVLAGRLHRGLFWAGCSQTKVILGDPRCLETLWFAWHPFVRLHFLILEPLLSSISSLRASANRRKNSVFIAMAVLSLIPHYGGFVKPWTRTEFGSGRRPDRNRSTVRWRCHPRWLYATSRIRTRLQRYRVAIAGTVVSKGEC